MLVWCFIESHCSSGTAAPASESVHAPLVIVLPTHHLLYPSTNPSCKSQTSSLSYPYVTLFPFGYSLHVWQHWIKNLVRTLAPAISSKFKSCRHTPICGLRRGLPSGKTSSASVELSLDVREHMARLATERATSPLNNASYHFTPFPWSLRSLRESGSPSICLILAAGRSWHCGTKSSSEFF